MQVAIIGAGIGGLTAALALQRHGVGVKIYERAPSLGEVGAGIQISPNATRVLEALGLGEALAAIGFLPGFLRMRDGRTGDLVSEIPVGRAGIERYGFPYLHVHRADLHTILLNAVRDRDPEAVVVAAECVDFDTWSDGVEVRFADGRAVEADAIIGADGIHTIVGKNLFGADKPRFTGNVAWRGLVPAASLPQGLVPPDLTVWVGPGKHLVQYFVRRGELVNYAAILEEDCWTTESWTEPGRKSELLARLADWGPEVCTLVEATQSLFRWALFDRDPRAQWSQGRATLLGDAAHPMLPFLAQGAAMAIEDAYVLADRLVSVPSATDALAQYEALRKERTANVQLGARRNAETFHMNIGSSQQGDPRSFSGGQGGGAAALDWIYRYDALAAAAQTRRVASGPGATVKAMVT